MTLQKNSSDTKCTSHENDEFVSDSGDSAERDQVNKVAVVDNDVDNLSQADEIRVVLNEEYASKWSKTFRKGTFVFAHILLLLCPIMMGYWSAMGDLQRGTLGRLKLNNLLNDLEELIMKEHFNWSSVENEGNVQLINSTLPNALLAPKLFRWRLCSLYMFPFLVLPDISQNIWIFIADIHRKKRFDITLLMLLLMSSLPIMSLTMASSTQPGLLCGSLLDSDELNWFLSMDRSGYSWQVSVPFHSATNVTRRDCCDSHSISDVGAELPNHYNTWIGSVLLHC